MSEGYEISKYQPGYKAQVAEFQRNLWSPDSRLNTAYLEWKYEQNPYLTTIPIYLCWHRGELVGMRGFYGSAWEAGNPSERRFVYCADDLVIAPAHRNRGLFTKIMKAAFDDLETEGDGFAFTLSGGQTTVLGSLTMGWKSLGGIHQVRRPSSSAWRGWSFRSRLDALPFVWKCSTWWRAPWDRDQFAHLDANARNASRPSDAVWLGKEARPDAMAELVEGLGTDGRIRHVRDRAFFDWRFRNPLREYRFLYAGSSHLTGYLVLRRAVSDRLDHFGVYISDWEASDSRVKEELLRAANTWGDFSLLNAWTATLSEETCRILQRGGFTDLVPSGPGQQTVVVRSLRGRSTRDWSIGGRPLLDLSNWDLRMLYSMHG